MSLADPLERPHVFQPGRGGRPLLLLHGTGGDEHDLLGLGQVLSPDGALLSVRGSVLEGTMPRFFRRLAEGVFDEDDLRRRAGNLAAFVRAAADRYHIAPGLLTIVGFSNGANIGSALLAADPDRYAGAVLFAAMPPYRAGFAGTDLNGSEVLISNGDRDPIATPALTATLAAQLESAGAEVRLVPHPGSHQISPASVATISELLTQRRLVSSAADPTPEAPVPPPTSHNQ